jgi:hypothetical protein
MTNRCNVREFLGSLTMPRFHTITHVTENLIAAVRMLDLRWEDLYQPTRTTDQTPNSSVIHPYEI